MCTKLLLTACMPTHVLHQSQWAWTCIVQQDVLIPAHNKILIDTGIAFQIPMGYYGQNSL